MSTPLTFYDEIDGPLYSCWAVNEDGTEERDPEKRKHRRSLAHRTRQWGHENLANYATKEEAHQACKVFVVDDLIIAWLAETIISWIIWRIMDNIWDHYHPKTSSGLEGDLV